MFTIFISYHDSLLRAAMSRLGHFFSDTTSFLSVGREQMLELEFLINYLHNLAY